MNIKMAVCDDLKSIHDIIKSYIEKYQIKTDNTIHADYFSSGIELLETYEKNNKYDIILMDVVMPEKDGIETVNEIRQKYDKFVTVYFLSDYMEHMSESFDVRPRNYLLKPFNYDDFCKTFDLFTNEASDNNSVMILTKTKDFFEIINVKDIIYVKTQKENSDCKTLLYSTKRGQSHRSGRLSTVEKQLIHYGFLRVHKQYIVNLAEIRRFDSKNLLLSNGETIPLRRGMSKEIQNLFLDGMLII